LDWTLTTMVAGGFLGLLLLVGLWELAVRRAHNRRWREELGETKRIGGDKPLSQHPHIDRGRCIGCGCCVRACPEKVLAVVHGTAHLVYASQCVGHAYCEQVCPVGAITVGLGDITLRPDIPILSENLESSVPGVFIAGELGGMALIRHGVNQGVHAVNEIARRLQNCGGERELAGVADVLIVGCGPAGIAATLRARQLELLYVTIDRNGLGGAVRKYPHNKVTMTQPVDVPLHGRLRNTKYRREDLLQLWEELFTRLGIAVHHGQEWTGVRTLPDGTLESTTSKGMIVSRYVILAMGRRSTPLRLGVAGEDLPHVFYHLEDPAAYTDQPLLVVGGGDSAVEAAIALAQGQGNRVTLSYRRSEFFRVRRKNAEVLDRVRREGRLEVIFNSHVKRIERDHVVLAIHNKKGQTEKHLSATAVFILIGGAPPFRLLRQAGIRFGDSAGR
jgi:thioredoxin reductase (NADPH)